MRRYFVINILVLDACCILNLYATGRMEEILAALPYQTMVVQYVVQDEALYVGKGEDIETLDFSTFAPKVLAVIDLENGKESDTAVQLSADLDDGEAQSCAVAIHRGGMIATDDRKTLRLMRSMEPPVPALRTSDLLAEWAQRKDIERTELARIVRAIRERASFLPSRRDPRRAWWIALLEEAS